jgi:aspartyl-tRNA(Asn)/glutamyl-tRNA(Gln) amidotransferase subunit B
MSENSHRLAEEVTGSPYEAVIGLEIHAELQTQSKMFCSCAVVDATTAAPNTAVCPVCAGMPGVLPVLNGRAVEFGVRVALALGCRVNLYSLFARKNYFYPDLPKGYQISQYEEPLARNGSITIESEAGAQTVRVRRVHLEEDTGKLTHTGEASRLDLNRAGVPLLEIVSEPDLHSAAAARRYAEAIRSILVYLGVNSGDMQKGVMRVEPNVSLRRAGSFELGTRTEIKNLNSFRALERGIEYEIARQAKILEAGGKVRQETVGWDEARQVTFTQRVKEGEEDYCYFPEPDLPPLLLEESWVEAIRRDLPELPQQKQGRFQAQYGLNAYDAGVLAADREVADYFEAAAGTAPVPPKTVANWVTGDLFSLLNQAGRGIAVLKVKPAALGELLALVQQGAINAATAKTVLAEMVQTGEAAPAIVARRGLRQVSDSAAIAGLIDTVLAGNPAEVTAYLGGKEGLLNWFFGQVMRAAGGKANPNVVREQLAQKLEVIRKTGFMEDAEP